MSELNPTENDVTNDVGFDVKAILAEEKRVKEMAANAIADGDLNRAVEINRLSRHFNQTQFAIHNHFDQRIQQYKKDIAGQALSEAPSFSEWAGQNNQLAPALKDDVKTLTEVEKLYAIHKAKQEANLAYRTPEELEEGEAFEIDITEGVDLEELTKHEQMQQASFAASVIGEKENRLGQMWNQARLGFIRMDSPFLEESERLEKFISEGSERFEDSVMFAPSKALGQMTDMFSSFREEMASGAAKASAFGAVALGAASIAGVTGAAAFSPLLAMAGAGAIYNSTRALEAGLAFKELVESGVSIDKARTISALIGTVNGLIEAIGDIALGGVIGGVVKGTILKGISYKVAKALQEKSALNAVANVALGYAGGISTEVATEVLQEVVGISGEEIGRIWSGTGKEGITLDEAQDRLVDIAVQTFKAAAVLGGIGAVPVITHQVRLVKEANERRDQFLALVEQMKNVQAVQSAPEVVADAVQHMANNAETPTVFIDGAAFAQTMQEAGITAEELQQTLPEVASQLEQAQRTGGDVKIPMGDYAAKIAPTDMGEALAQHVRVDEEALSSYEAQQVQAAYKGLVKDAVKDWKSIKSDIDQMLDDEYGEVAKQIEEDAFGVLKQHPKFNQSKARTQARLASLVVSNLARRAKIAPSKMRELAPQILMQSSQQGFNQEPMVREGITRKPDSAQATVVEIPENQVPQFKTVKELKKWIVAQLAETNTAVVKSTNQKIRVGSAGVRDSLKRRREEKHNDVYSKLISVLENAEYDHFEENDGQEKHNGLKGQDIYYSAIRIGGKLYGVKIKVDVPGEKEIEWRKDHGAENIEDARYKDHTLNEIDLSEVSVHQGLNPADTQQVSVADATLSVSLGVLRGQVKPSRLEDGVLNQSEITSSGRPERALKRTLDNMTPEEREVFDEYIQSRPDADRIMGNLERLKDTPWAKQAIEAVFVRIALRDLLDGKQPRVQSMLDHSQMRNQRQILERFGENGLWMIFEDKGFIGNASKPNHNVNSSFINCDPSKDCAKFCYATSGNYTYAATVVKSELVSEAIARDPIRAASMTARQYKATSQYDAGKALRLFDKGDGDATWLPYIEELNRQGVRVQIFSKRPEFLRQVSDFNLRLLSIDESNKSLAKENPDLSVAFVYSSESQIPEVLELHRQGRLQVVLPVKQGRNLLNEEKIVKLIRMDKSVAKHVCPIDAGWKAIKDKKNPDGWNCTMCDKNGGVGCYHGKTTEIAMRRASTLDSGLAKMESMSTEALMREIERTKKELDDGLRSLERNRSVSGRVDDQSGSVRGSSGGSGIDDVSHKLDTLLQSLFSRINAGIQSESGQWVEGSPQGILPLSTHGGRGELADSAGNGSDSTIGSRDGTIDREDSEQATGSGRGGRALEQSAFHGSPHQFESFNTDHIGTGEGAQAHGWGLYFAQERDTAEVYRARLTGGQIYYKGKDILNLYRQIERGPISEIGRLAILEELMGTQSLPEMRKNAAEYIEDEVWRQEDWDWFEKEVAPYITQEGRVFEVDVPENDVLLDEQKLIYDQPLSVLESLGSIKKWPHAHRFKNIAALYKEAESVGGEKAVKTVREFLHKGLIDREGEAFQTEKEWNDFVASLGGNEAFAEKVLNQYIEEQHSWNAPSTGAQIYGDLTQLFGNPKKASLALNKAGIKGITYDGEQDGRCFVVFDDKAVKVLEYYQDKQGPRGFFDPDTNQINLNLNADLSTFSHEIGHWYLENLLQLSKVAGVDPTVTEDTNTILKEFGLSSVDEWDALDFESKRKLHERFAYQVEVYLSTGKAPVSSLDKFFARLGLWITDVYRQFKGMTAGQRSAQYRKEFGEDLPDISPELRRVLDRMVAAQDMVKQAEAAESLRPLFDTKPDGMSDEDWEQFLSDQSIAEQEGIAAYHKALAKDEKWYTKAHSKEVRRLQREGQELRAEIREKVEKQVRNRPVYVALDALKSGGKAFGIENLKMAPESLEAFGLNVNQIAKLRSMGCVRQGGLSVSATRQLLEPFARFKNDRRFINLLLHAKPLNEVIEEETTKRCLQKNSVLFNPTKLDELATQALHSKARERIIEHELKYLGASQNLNSRVMREAAKKAAKDFIARQPLGEVRVKRFMALESRASRKAFEAVKNGDRQAAFAAKLQQLFNHECTKIALELEKDSRRMRDLRNKIFKADKELAKSYDMGPIYVARFVLTNHGLGKGSADNFDPSDCLKHIEKIEQYNPESYAVYEKIVSRHGYDPMRGRITEAPTGEVQKMMADLKWLMDQARSNKTISIEGKKLDRKQVVDELIAQGESLNLKSHDVGTKEATTKKEKAVTGLCGIAAALRRVESWCNSMDAGNKNHPFRRYIYDPIATAASKYRNANSEMQKKFAELLKKYQPSLTKLSDIEAPEIGYTFRSKMELIGAILHTGNQSNKQKLLLGGRGRKKYPWARVIETPDGQKFVDTSAWDNFIARCYREGIITKEDMDFVQGVWDLMESIKPQIQKTFYEVYGYYFEEIEAQEIQTPFGTYRGGYVPAMTDRDLVENRSLQEEATRITETEFTSIMPVSRPGFSQSRIAGYTEPLDLDLSRLCGHIQKTLQFAYIALPAQEVGKILSDKRFVDFTHEYTPKVLENLLLPWLKRSYHQRVNDGKEDAISNLLNKYRALAGMAIMAGNVVNAAQQITGFSIALNKVKAKSLALSMKRLMSKTRTIEDIMQLSPFMRSRLENRAFEYQSKLERIAKSSGRLLSQKGAFNKVAVFDEKLDPARDWIASHAYFLQVAVQGLMDPVVWGAAFDEAITQGMTVEEAVAEADSVVRTTQSSFNPEDVADIETGSSFKRAFLVFYNYFGMQLNLMLEKRSQARLQPAIKKYGMFASTFMLTVYIPAVVAKMIELALKGEFGGDDEDEWEAIDWLQLFLGEPVKNLFAMVPFAGGVTNSLGAMLAKQENEVAQLIFGKDPYVGKPMSSPAVDLLENSFKAITDLYRMYDGDDVSMRKITREMLDLLTLISRIPVGALKKPLGYGAGVLNDETDSGIIEGIISGR